MRIFADTSDIPTGSVFRFPTVGVPSSWELTQDQITRWQQLFPRIDVPTQIRYALAWSLANPAKRKTARGMLRFLVGWLTRASERVTLEPTRTYTTDYCPHVEHCSNRGECRVNITLGKKLLKSSVSA